ncbi:MAG: response regulator [Rhodobacteraceae bacterium]|nr:response regulator [Paracoccaceae bacterium]
MSSLWVIALFEGGVIVATIAVLTGLFRHNTRTSKRLKKVQRQLAKVRKVVRDRADDAAEVKLEFLSKMSRDIRTPLNGVIGMTNLILGTRLDAEQRAYANSVARSGEGLLDLLNDILDFSRLEAGSMALEVIPFNLQTLLEEVSNLLAPKAQKKGLELILRYAPGTARYVVGDPGRIHQIMMNLANNALNHTEEGHVLISVEGEDGRSAKEVTFKVRVEDTGRGIAKNKLGHIFEKFAGDVFPTSEFDGTVLGLALTREFVEMMGGEISVDSNLDEGTVFSFDMTLLRDLGRNTPGVIAYEGDLSGVRVLVVDDNKVAGEIIAEQLLARDMVVERANSGAEALGMLISAVRNEFEFDVMVTDYNMAEMNGIELAVAIRNNVEIRDISLVMLSSASAELDAPEVEQAGYSGYLPKPVSESELLRTLSAVWSAKQNKMPLPLMTRQILRQETLFRAGPQNEDVNFEGVQVLLAEDNSVNLMVTRKILSNVGCLVTSAGTGLEAVELVKQRNFDLILMDCLMPEMDGYTATGLIIEYQRDKGLTPSPVIAFTANAMTGDEEKCLAAGMDDYISKPVQPDMLIDVMSRWLTAVLAERDRKDKISQEQREACVIEPDVLNMLKSMTGDSFIPVLESYIRMAVKAVPALADALRVKDAITLRREAHSLKSSSLQVGALQVGHLAGQIEKMSLESRFDDILTVFPPISDMSTRVVGHLKDYIRSYPS